MAKYKVEVGGFVSTFRQRTFTVYADNEAEAENKAINRFVECQQQKSGNMCDGGTVDSIEEIQ